MTRNHSDELRSVLDDLQYVNQTISGTEGLFEDIFSSVSQSALNGAKLAGGAAVDGMVALFKKANKAITLAYGSHKTKFTMLNKGLSEVEDDSSIPFSKSLLSNLTGTGSIDDLEPALIRLIKVLKTLDNHRLDIEAFYHKEISLFSDYTSVKTVDDAVKLIKKLDDLKYPLVDFGNKDDSMSISVTLPGGKHLAFNSEKLEYKIGSEDVSGKETGDEYSKSQAKGLLSELDDLDDVYGRIKKANENYIQYLEKFNTVVKGAFVHVDGLKGDISVSLIRDLQSRLEGDKHVFAFYSGFLPKVLTYVDSYIDTLSNHLSKQFN